MNNEMTLTELQEEIESDFFMTEWNDFIIECKIRKIEKSDANFELFQAGMIDTAFPMARIDYLVAKRMTDLSWSRLYTKAETYRLVEEEESFKTDDSDLFEDWDDMPF